MSAALAESAEIGASIEVKHYGYTRPDRRQTTIKLYGDHYGDINLALVRRALDTLTLEDETAVVGVRFSKLHWDGYSYKNRVLKFSLAPDGKVRIKAPCGETRRYNVKTLDRVLTRLGF